jgi:hypothetical protein
MFFRKAAVAVPLPAADASERRTGHRVRYPDARAERRPFLFWAGGPAPVVDFSQRGVRLEIPPTAPRPRTGDHIRGQLMFHDCTIAVSGVVRHVRGRVVGLELRTPGIPLRVLRAEERQLARRGPHAAFTR